MCYVSVTVDDLFDFLFDGVLQAKELAVLWRGYIDDSADRNRQKVIISACLLGDCDQWRAFVRPWKTKLAENGISYFKSSEHLSLSGQFLQFRSPLNYPKPKGRDTADKIRDDLDQIIKNSEVTGIGVIVPVAAFNKIYSEPQYAAIISRDPYKWAVQILWDQCTKAMEELGRNHMVTFAHDDGDNYDALRSLYRNYKSKNPKSAKRLADFVPLEDEAHPTIQAADVAASVTQKLAIQWLDDPNTATLHRLTTNMYKAVVTTEEWMRGALDCVIKYRAKTGKVA